MAFKRSAVRSRLSPPGKSEVTRFGFFRCAKSDFFIARRQLEHYSGKQNTAVRSRFSPPRKSEVTRFGFFHCAKAVGALFRQTKHSGSIPFLSTKEIRSYALRIFSLREGGWSAIQANKTQRFDPVSLHQGNPKLRASDFFIARRRLERYSGKQNTAVRSRFSPPRKN